MANAFAWLDALPEAKRATYSEAVRSHRDLDAKLASDYLQWYKEQPDVPLKQLKKSVNGLAAASKACCCR